MDPKHTHVTGEDTFANRREALEEAFFARKNRELLEKRRAERAAEETEEALAVATGIQNPTLLGRLVEQGVNADTLVAISLIPLVAIAWADDTLEQEEKDAIFKAAGEAGITEGSAAAALLEHWLEEEPGPQLIETWRDYVQALIQTLDDDEIAELKKEVLDRAHDVAFAAGGFLGIGAVNWMEKRTLNELAEAFEK